MQPFNALLPGAGFAVEKLLAPRQAIVAYFARVPLAPSGTELVPLSEAFGRVLSAPVDADDEYPNADRSAMDGFAVVAAATPGSFAICGDVSMGAPARSPLAPAQTMRIPTGGMLPPGADAVVPIEDAVVRGDTAIVRERFAAADNVVARGADMHRGQAVLSAGRRIGAGQLGVLATLGVTAVPVFRRPVVAVLSSGDELVDASDCPGPGQVRDSNRYAIAGSLQAMGALVRHYPKVPDEAAQFEAALTAAVRECDAVMMTGGSSVGDRDRMPGAVAKLGEPGIVVHGLRIRPGKPALLGAIGAKPVLGLPGNPASALMVLEAVAAPIVAALAGAPAAAATVEARLTAAVRGRLGWTWYVPMALRDEGGACMAHPLPLRSFSVNLMALADGYAVMGERDEEWPAGANVTVHRFFGG
jgi:molybdopterin molybdotransferase